jgi:hypothetical protein
VCIGGTIARVLSSTHPSAWAAMVSGFIAFSPMSG